MATGTAGSTARRNTEQVIHYLRLGITKADATLVKTIGTLPAGSQILNTISGVYVREAFNAGTNNRLDIGTSANDDLYGTDMSLASVAFVVLDEAASATDVNAWYFTTDTTLIATVDVTGTAATTGAAEIVIAYTVDNDR